MCLYPRIIKNPRYRQESEHCWQYSDARVLAVAIGCGKCWECRRKKVREWKLRIQWEMDKNPIRGRGMTLTFADKFFKENSGDEHELTAKALNHFRKRWQKKYKESPRYWAINELGQNGTERLHIHGIIWTDKTAEEIEQTWMYGQIKIKPIKGVDYFLKYVNKVDMLHPNFFPKIFCSKGIGKDFFNSQTFIDIQRTERQYIRLKDGTKIDIPIYYRNKLWDVKKREELWCKLLDQKKRYVRGEEIDVSTPAGEQRYMRTLEQAQIETERIGYPRSPWSKEKYSADKHHFIDINVNT